MRKPRRIRRLGGLLGGLLLAVTLGAGAQQAAPGAEVVAVEVQPAPGRSAADYQGLIRQPLGQPPRRDLVGESLRALYATGEFADVQAVEYPAAGGGVRLVFATQPNYFIASLQVENGPDPPGGTELEDASGLNIGQTYSRAALAQAAAKIEERLRNYGYYRSRVLPAAALDPHTSQAMLTFQVLAGPLVRAGAIRFTGELAAPAAELRRALTLRQGEPLSHDRLAGGVNALQALYTRMGRLTASVTLNPPEFVAAANQLNLTFSIDPGPRVEITTAGMHLPAGVLRRQIPIYQEHADDVALVEEGRRNLVNYLQGQGYYTATVEDRRTVVNADLLRIVYTIRPGPKESLAAILFRGNQYFDADDLAARAAIRPASAWPSAIPGARGLYTSALAQASATAMAELYRANGFADVQVVPAVVPGYRGRPRQIAVEFQIEEGPQTLVGGLQIAGASAANRTAIAALLTTAVGQPFAASKLAADRSAILTYYANAGYAGASCVSQAVAAETPDEESGPRMDVTFTIHEGAVQTIHRVYIAGDHYVRGGLIAHELQLEPGQPLSQAALLQSQRALYDTGLFTSATVTPRNPNGDEAGQDVFVTVEEARRYSFSEGVGLQIQSGTGGAADLQDVLGHTGYSPLFSFNATRTAVGGTDQTVSLNSTYSTLQKRAVLDYGVPELLGDPALHADFSTFYDDTFDIRTFRAVREQVGMQIEQTVNAAVGWTYSVDFRQVRVLSPLVAPQEIPLLSETTQLAEFTASYHRDHRDDPLDTHQGSYNSFQWGIAKTFNTAFADFGRLDYENRWYHALNRAGNVVLARSTQVGVELPFGPRSLVTYTNPVTGVSSSSLEYVVPLPERYLSGGPDSLRGFSIEQAGPRDPVTAFPVGGEALFINNLELRFPLIGDNIGGVVFYDLGNVYSTPAEMLRSIARWQPSPGNENFTSHTVGLGLRYRTPVGPVRFDTGYMLNPPTFDYFSTGANPTVLNQRLPPFHFFFSIGETF